VGEGLVSFSGESIHLVKYLLEKPDLDTCRSALAAGALWNTMILTARLENLWRMGWLCFPETMLHFETFSRAIGTSREEETLERIYHQMPVSNFSKGLLERLPQQVAVMRLDQIVWSDWANPKRIVETISYLGRRPTFPLALVTGVGS
jgi:mannose-1-phosphate guanylyltransferase